MKQEGLGHFKKYTYILTWTAHLHRDLINITQVHNTLDVFLQCPLYFATVTNSHSSHLADHFQSQCVTVEKTEAVATFP